VLYHISYPQNSSGDMVVPKYTNTGPVDVGATYVPENLKNKSVIITGGMSYDNAYL